MNVVFRAVVPVVMFTAFLNCESSAIPEIKMNDMQVIGSHNSYKKAIEPLVLDYLFQLDSTTARSLQYEHPSLTKQLELGLRNLELDVFYDPKGGYFSNPGGLEIVKTSGGTPLPFDVDEQLKEPGLKVFHVQEIDFRSTQLLFKEALRELKSWSDTHQNHYPIIITINAKDAKIPNTREPLPFSAAAIKRIDEEIRSVLVAGQLVTPDLVRGDFSTLEEAVLTAGWPTVKTTQGKFLFVLDEGKEKTDRYLMHFPNLEGAAVFVNGEEGTPEAGFRILNNPVADFEKIKTLVAKGYMVRTRADANTMEARNNDYSRFEKAKTSGAQVITTDYYLPSTLFTSDFKVSFQDGTYERVKED